MKIILKYDTIIGKFMNAEKYKSNSLIEVPDRCTMRELILLLGIPKERQESITVHVNDQPAWSSTILRENDIVNLFTALGGG